MNLVYIWYCPVERVTIERLLHAERSSWRLKCMPESEVADLESTVRLLKSNHDAIMVHLSKPPCVALKMAELVHHGKFQTRVLVLSKTDADPDAISALFNGHIHPECDIARLGDRIAELVAKPPSYLQSRGAIEEAIVRILNTDSVFQYQFRQKFAVLYRHPFTIEDYRRFATHV